MAFVDTSIHACDDLNVFIGSSPSPETLDDFIKDLKAKKPCQKSLAATKKSLKSALNIPSQAYGCFVNGRKVVFSRNGFNRQDFGTLVNYELRNRIKSYAASITDALFDLNLKREEMADRILYITSILSKVVLSPSGEQIKRTSLSMFDNFQGSKM